MDYEKTSADPEKVYAAIARIISRRENVKVSIKVKKIKLRQKLLNQRRNVIE